jgi:outer membrane protein assembly factor BamE (lipoprotein component of BamABCDE complex)
MRIDRNAHQEHGKMLTARPRHVASPRGTMLRRLARLAVTVAAAAALAACSTQTLKHGHQFRENDLAQVQPGMSQDQVKLTLGTPATTATVAGGNAYYYISSTAEQVAFLSPKEVDRQVVAVYFNPLGSVDRVANYGMKDGKVFDFVTRKTPAPGVGDEGILKSLFRNLGKKQLFGE